MTRFSAVGLSFLFKGLDLSLFVFGVVAFGKATFNAAVRFSWEMIGAEGTETVVDNDAAASADGGNEDGGKEEDDATDENEGAETDGFAFSMTEAGGAGVDCVISRCSRLSIFRCMQQIRLNS